MRFAINLSCCCIMASASFFNLWMGDFRNALFCAVVACFTGFTAYVCYLIQGR